MHKLLVISFILLEILSNLMLSVLNRLRGGRGGGGGGGCFILRLKSVKRCNSYLLTLNREGGGVSLNGQSLLSMTMTVTMKNIFSAKIMCNVIIHNL